MNPLWHVWFMSIVAAFNISAALAILKFTRRPALNKESTSLQNGKREVAATWILTAVFALNYACFAIFFATLEPEWPDKSSIDEAGQNV